MRAAGWDCVSQFILEVQKPMKRPWDSLGPLRTLSEANTGSSNEHRAILHQAKKT